MAKMVWDAFVTKHNSGYCLIIPTNRTSFPQPKGVGPKNGKTWPSISAMISLYIKDYINDDWSIRNETHTIKNINKSSKNNSQKILITHLIFSSPADATNIAKKFLFDIIKSPQNTKIDAPCKTSHTLPAFERKEYGDLAKHFGYIE